LPFLFSSLGYRSFMMAIQSQILVLNKILSSAPKKSADAETGALSAVVSGAATAGTNLLNKPVATPSMPQSTESLASQPMKPTLGKLRLVSAPSSSSISPNGSSLDSLEEETAEDALQQAELSELTSGEVVEEGGCVIS
jgi:hypothetical protein